MSRTFTNVIDRARVPLQDADKTRYTDADLLSYANDAILLLRKGRADLFFGSYGSYPSAEYTAGNTVPVPDEYFPALADYVTARALFREDEAAVMSHADAFFKLFAGA